MFHITPNSFYNYNCPNTAFEFYLSLPNDKRTYRITYIKLNSSKIVRLLNHGISLSHIPDYQLPHHYDINL